MKKFNFTKITSNALLLMFMLALLLPVLAPAIEAKAEAAKQYVVDDEDLLSDIEEEVLAEQLIAASDKYGVDIVALTTASFDGKSDMAYADDYYDYNGYADDGVLLLISGTERKWWVSTKGLAIKALSDDDIDYIGEQISPYLKDGDYFSAFVTYGTICDYEIDKVVNRKFEFKFVLVAIIIGCIISWIIVRINVSACKSVAMQRSAANYMKQGSMNVTQAREFYLYSTVTKTAKPEKDSSTHTSSSGSSHGGGGGSF